jgi:hypothetical protein
MGPAGSPGPIGPAGPAGPARPIGPTGPAGSLTLPYTKTSASIAVPGSASFNVVNNGASGNAGYFGKNPSTDPATGLQGGTGNALYLANHATGHGLYSEAHGAGHAAKLRTFNSTMPTLRAAQSNVGRYAGYFYGKLAVGQIDAENAELLAHVQIAPDDGDAAPRLTLFEAGGFGLPAKRIDIDAEVGGSGAQIVLYSESNDASIILDADYSATKKSRNRRAGHGARDRRRAAGRAGRLELPLRPQGRGRGLRRGRHRAGPAHGSGGRGLGRHAGRHDRPRVRQVLGGERRDPAGRSAHHGRAGRARHARHRRREL